MTSGTTNASSLSNSIVTMYHRKQFLKNFEANLVMSQFGVEPITLPSGEGDKVKWHRWKPINGINRGTGTTGAIPSYAFGKLTDGTTPTSNVELSTVVVSAQLQQRGGYALITDLAEFEALSSPMKSGAIETLSRVGAQAYEDMILSSLYGNCTTKYVNGKTVLSDLEASDIIDADEILKQVSRLTLSGVMPFEGQDYIGVFSPEQVYDLRSGTAAGSWLDISKYDNSAMIRNGEIGKLYGVKMYQAHRLLTQSVTSALNARSAFVMGYGAYGIADTARKGVEIVVQPFGSSGTLDPLKQRATVGVKFYAVAKVLQASAIIQLKSAITRL